MENVTEDTRADLVAGVATSWRARINREKSVRVRLKSLKLAFVGCWERLEE